MKWWAVGRGGSRFGLKTFEKCGETVNNVLSVFSRTAEDLEKKNSRFIS